MKRRSLILAVCAALVPLRVRAHGPKGTKPAGANGGEIADVEGGHLEFAPSPTELRIYVTDMKDVAFASAGMTGRVIVQDGDKQIVLPLLARAPNLLVAPLAAPLSKDAKVAVSATFAKDAKPVQARFVMK
jgi:hypothetical protein